MTETLTGFLYLIARFCFILALRGLSSPRPRAQGNIFGIVGMVIADGDDARRSGAWSATG